jgi:hypothetical protein
MQPLSLRVVDVWSSLFPRLDFYASRLLPRLNAILKWVTVTMKRANYKEKGKHLTIIETCHRNGVPKKWVNVTHYAHALSSNSDPLSLFLQKK